MLFAKSPPAHLIFTVALAFPSGLAAQGVPAFGPATDSEFLGPSLTLTSAVGQPLTTPLALPLDQEESHPTSPAAEDYALVLGGAVGAGVLIGGALGLLGSRLGDTDAQENVGGLVGSIALGGIGYSVGSVLGAYAVGNRRHPKDSMKSTWVGGLIGMLAGTAVGFAQPDDNLNGLWLPAALLGPPVGAVIGFFH